MKLIAKIDILYHGKIYEAGSELPQNDEPMRKAWLSAGTAYYPEEAKAEEAHEEVTEEPEETAEQPEAAEAPAEEVQVPKGRKSRQ